MRVNLGSLVGSWIVLMASAVSLVAAGDLRLIEAVKNNNTAAVLDLLTHHADVNAPQGDGATALHWAVHLDDLSTAELLIQAGAHVNVANDIGDAVSPVMSASAGRAATSRRRARSVRSIPALDLQ